MSLVAALFVDRDGCYSGLPGVDVWDTVRDARLYAGPWPVVAHPPCQRWGRYWGGSPRKPHQYMLGDDDGCFAAALASLRRYGGVLEHPKDSLAWTHFGLRKPPHGGGWVEAGTTADGLQEWTCCVYQGHYGHFSPKATWLYAVGPRPPELVWGMMRQVLPEWMLERYGRKKATRIGLMAMVGGKDKTRIREATPPVFRDVLLAIARAR